ncbi:MAG: hypothetical protein Q9217_005243 [Psora testacea]
MPPYHPTSPAPLGADRPTATASWSSDNDKLLMRLRGQQRLDWKSISAYFPNKSANACRKRHERLMEKRTVADPWDGAKMDTLAKTYNDVREEMWRILADRVGEKWQIVETKCMEKGLITLQSIGRSASRRERNRTSNSLQADDNPLDTYVHGHGPSHFPRSRSDSHDNNSENFNDSAIVTETDLPYATRPRDDEQQQAPYSTGGLTNSPPSSLPTNRTPSTSTVSFSIPSMTPTITAAPQFPSPTTPGEPHRTLPSFNDGFSRLPSVLAASLPRNQPSFSISPPVTTH